MEISEKEYSSLIEDLHTPDKSLKQIEKENKVFNRNKLEL